MHHDGTAYMVNHTTKETRWLPHTPHDPGLDASQLEMLEGQRQQQNYNQSHQHQHQHPPPNPEAVFVDAGSDPNTSRNQMRPREEKHDEIDSPMVKVTKPKTNRIIKEILAKGEISRDNWDFLKKRLTHRDLETMPATTLAHLVRLLPNEIKSKILQGISTKDREHTTPVGDGGDSACYADSTGGEEEEQQEEEKWKDGEETEVGDSNDEWEDDADNTEEGNQDKDEEGDGMDEMDETA